MQPSFSSWDQLGRDLDGSDSSANFGISLALSDDGRTLAVGQIRYARVYIFDWNITANDWTLRGDAISVESPYGGPNFGFSVDLSGDGNVVAVGAMNEIIPINNTDTNLVVETITAGTARVFEWDEYNNSWKMKGQVLTGNVDRGNFGASIALSNDGMVVAVGAPSGRSIADQNIQGYVQVWGWSSNESNMWSLRGTKLSGTHNQDLFGYDVALSADGSVLALSAPWYTGIPHIRLGQDPSPQEDPFTSVSRIGMVATYDWVEDEWIPRLSPFTGDIKDDAIGNAVSLSNDGTVLAIGAYLKKGLRQNLSGQVQLFKWTSGTNWLELGDAILGETSGARAGFAVSLSSDGGRVTLTSRRNRGNARVYEWRNSTTPENNAENGQYDGEWHAIGLPIHGENIHDQSGHSVALSAFGDVIAISALWNDGEDGQLPYSGHVRVFSHG